MTIIHHSQPEWGVAWKLPMHRRDLDSNIIGLSPGASIGAHVGPDLDMLFVLDGTGHLATEVHTIDLHPGAAHHNISQRHANIRPISVQAGVVTGVCVNARRRALR